MKVTPPVQPTKGQIELTKTDGQQTPLAGADYDLFDSQQKKVGSYITDQKGQITVSKLATGAYYFVETVAPAGYEKDSQRHPVTVVANQTATVTVTDQKTPSQPSVPVTPTTPTAPSIPAQTGSTSVQPVTNPTGTQTASQSANTATLPQTGEVNERIWQYVGLAVLFGELLAMGLWWQHRSKQE
jgi:uncharacterized surface anchored protein